MRLVGSARLARDAEVRYTPDGSAVANLNLVWNYGRKDESGKRPSTWVSAALFGKQAEGLAPYLVKGVGLDLTIDDVRVETYKKNDGSAGTSLKGIVRTIEFCPNKRDEGQKSGEEFAPRPVSATPPPMRSTPPSMDNFDDDIPF